MFSSFAVGVDTPAQLRVKRAVIAVRGGRPLFPELGLEAEVGAEKGFLLFVFVGLSGFVTCGSRISLGHRGDSPLSVSYR